MPGRLTFHLIPHTHWDREWYLPRAALQARLVPVLDDVLAQLENDPAARFLLDGQTVLVEDYLAVRPECRPRISAPAARSALELGPWYVLSDLLVPSGASLRRNLEEGTRDTAQFGKRLDVLYSPDAFGHPAELPELAKEVGIRWGVVRRGLGRPNKRDRDLYRWEGPGGAGLLVYHLPAAGYDPALELARAGAALEREWPPLRRELVECAVTDQIAVFLGADHHAMVQDLAGFRSRLQALETGNTVRVSGLAEFFAAVERSTAEIPVLRGELRRTEGHTWVLQGTHSTRARMKRRHAHAELLLSRIAEPLATQAADLHGTDRSGLLRAAWRTLLQCQFHDTLAGTTSDEVQREQEVRLDAVIAASREIAAQSIGELAGHGSARLVLWNPGQHAHAGILTAELTFFRKDVRVGPPSGRKPRTGKGHQPFVLETPSGDTLPVQVLGLRRDQERVDSPRHYPDQDEVDRVWAAFRSPGIPPRDLREVTPRPLRRAPPDTGLTVAGGRLANRFVSLEVSRGGELTLHERWSGERYPGLGAVEDEPDRGDSYTFSRGSGLTVQKGRPVSRAIIAKGPLVGAVETRWTLESGKRGRISIRQLVILYADSPVVRLTLDVDNRATDHRLRARFPLGVSGAALAGTALGTARREPVTGRSAKASIEREAITAPAHRFVAAARGARGLALLAPAFFEYEWTREGELVVTLLRSVGQLSRDGLPERPGHAGWPMATPLAQEQGFHRIELALLAIGGEHLAHPQWLEQLWEETMVPVQAVFLREPRRG